MRRRDGLGWRGSSSWSLFSFSGGETEILSCVRNRKQTLVSVAIAALALAFSGCRPRGTRIELHYLPGFVPGSQNIFRPVKIAVPPTTSSIGSGDAQVGRIYRSDGNAQTALTVSDPARVFTDSLIKGLAGAGLNPVPLDSNPSDGKPVEGADFILSSEVEQFEVNKRFGPSQTIHGQYFSMRAVVRAKVTLSDRVGAALYTGEISGIESEPPNPVGGEVFLPLETIPAESLSVALSRAIGSLMLQPQFRSALPLQSAEAASSPTPAMPSGTPSPMKK